MAYEIYSFEDLTGDVNEKYREVGRLHNWNFIALNGETVHSNSEQVSKELF